MFCPNCGSQNGAEAKFCRGCGANLSLVPHAMTGTLPDAGYDKRGRPERKGPPSIANGVAAIMWGIGFIVAAFGVRYFAPAGSLWWFWMFIPAFGWLGQGMKEIIAAKQAVARFPQAGQMPPPRLNTNEFPVNQTPSELPRPPASVTDSTTKLFDETDRRG